MTHSARRNLNVLIGIGIALTILFGQWWFRPENIPSNFDGAFHGFDLAIFLFVSYVIWHQIIMEILNWTIVRKMHTYNSPEPQPGLKVAFITTYVPGAETPELLHNILPALVAADYPHDSWLLDEGDDDEAKRICQLYGVQYFTRKGTDKYNTSDGKFAAKTKGGNHNAWYDHMGHSYDLVAQIDTDFIPTKNFLTKTIGYFRDPTVAFVGTPQVYGNLDSWIAKGAAQQQYAFYGPLLRGLFGHQMTLMLGANHVVRVAALKRVNDYSAHLTEDLLTGMNLHAKHFRSVYVPEQLAIGEGPTTWQAYFNQQMRWAQGCMDILFHHSFALFKNMNTKRQLAYFFLQQHYFTGLATILGLVIITLYFLFGISPASAELIPMLLVYVPLLLWQYLIHRWLQRYYINPSQESGFHLNGILLSLAVWPIYFLAFIGAVRNKRLTFKVTPKGKNRPNRTDVKLFTPHIIIGSIAAVDLATIPITQNTNIVMIFWAAIIAISMFGIAFHQHIYSGYVLSKKILNTAIKSPLLTRQVNPEY